MTAEQLQYRIESDAAQSQYKRSQQERRISRQRVEEQIARDMAEYGKESE